MIYLEFELGEKYKALGMQRAIDHAGKEWADKALEAFKDWISWNGCSFTCEDFRREMAGRLPLPPNLRAFGAIIHKAAKLGLIVKVGTIKVKNPKAHRCYASLWIKNEK